MAKTMVWPVPFLINMFTALKHVKGSVLIFISFHFSQFVFRFA